MLLSKVNENEYFALLQQIKNENTNENEIIELFDDKIIYEYQLQPFQQLFCLKKKITNEIKQHIGIDDIQITITYPSKDTKQLTINQQKTFRDLLNQAAQLYGVNANQISMILNAKAIDEKDYDQKLFSQYVINNFRFQLLPKSQ